MKILHSIKNIFLNLLLVEVSRNRYSGALRQTRIPNCLCISIKGGKSLFASSRRHQRMVQCVAGNIQKLFQILNQVTVMEV